MDTQLNQNKVESLFKTNFKMTNILSNWVYKEYTSKVGIDEIKPEFQDICILKAMEIWIESGEEKLSYKHATEAVENFIQECISLKYEEVA